MYSQSWDELLVEQHTIPDGQATPVKAGAKHNQSLNYHSPYVVDVR
jgi:hypothetical protein